MESEDIDRMLENRILEREREINRTTINSVTDLIKVIEKLGKAALRTTESKTLRFFRGQSNYDWTLSPSLYRENLFNKERALILEAINMFPEEFEGLDKFSILVKLQHYGMKTRLLDLTENPLVALYFACNENNDKDGAIYIFDSIPTYFPEDLSVKCLMEYVFEFSGSLMEKEQAIKHFNKMLNISYYKIHLDPIDDLIGLLTIPGLAVSPKRNNPRLITQQGAFYLFGMKVKKVEIDKFSDYTLYSFEPREFLPKKEKRKILILDTKIISL